MKNPYRSLNTAQAGYMSTAYEKARQDAIKVVMAVENPYVFMLKWDFEEARKLFIEALKEE